jgi:hypothetical protein
VREAEASVHYGFPGTWRWEMAFHVPERYRWTLYTRGEPQHYVFDGTTVRAYVGTALVSSDPDRAAAFRTHARWVAVISLDILGDGARVSWAELPPGWGPAGSRRGIRARFADDGSVYELWFDAGGRLVAAEGPIDFAGLGSGSLRATFTDFRTAGRYVLPFASSYTFNAEPFFDERVRRIVPDVPGLDIGAVSAPPIPHSREAHSR